MTMVPRWLGLSFAEGVALMSLLPCVEVCLAGVPQLAFDDAGKPTSGDILDALMALDSARDWAKTHALSWIKTILSCSRRQLTRCVKRGSEFCQRH